jgi:2-keto-3-deoxy-L-rhamnonate aldolase RhmA
VNRAKEKLAKGGLVLCMGLRQARTVDIAMIAAQAGFDSVYLDMQHSPLSLETVSTICAGCHGLPITPAHGADWISRALDGGAQGVIVPDVSTAAQAAAVADAARFPPLGHRSVMGATPALAYEGLSLKAAIERLDLEALTVVMIETARGVEEAAAIAAVPGIDMLLIGSNDLCTGLGIPGELKHPKLRQAYESVAAACKRHGKTLGVGGIRGELELQRELVALGARFIIAGSDVTYLAGAARKDAEALKALL